MSRFEIGTVLLAPINGARFTVSAAPGAAVVTGRIIIHDIVQLGFSAGAFGGEVDAVFIVPLAR